jgi:hypothetical protein
VSDVSAPEAGCGQVLAFRATNAYVRERFGLERAIGGPWREAIETAEARLRVEVEGELNHG